MGVTDTDGTPAASAGQRIRSKAGTLRHVVNHLGVAVASKLVPVASIFVYSRLMSVADYGVLNLFQSYLWIFALALSMNLHVAVGRHIYQPNADTGAFLGTTVLSVGTIFVTGSLLVLAGRDFLSDRLGLPATALALMLAVVLGQLVESLLTQVATHDRRSGLLLAVVATKALSTLALSLALLWLLPSDKYLAVLLADATTSVLLALFSAALLRRRIIWTFRAEHLAYMARYALPLIPYMLSLTLLSQFDRVLIDRFFGKEATGLYSLAYNVGVLLLMLVTAVLNAFTPAFFEALNRRDAQRVRQDARTIFAFSLLLTVGLVLFGKDAATLILPARYAAGFSLIPLVALSGLCFVVFQIWVRILAFSHRTYAISVIAVLCTALNIGMNLWLLPLYGYQIAAATTLLAYIAMSALCVAAVNRLQDIVRVRLWRESAYICAAAALWLLVWQQSVPLEAKILLLLALAWHLRPDLTALAARSAR